MTSRSFEFDKGANQLFSHGKFHLIKPSQFKENEVSYIYIYTVYTVCIIIELHQSCPLSFGMQYHNYKVAN